MTLGILIAHGMHVCMMLFSGTGPLPSAALDLKNHQCTEVKGVLRKFEQPDSGDTSYTSSAGGGGQDLHVSRD